MKENGISVPKEKIGVFYHGNKQDTQTFRLER